MTADAARSIALNERRRLASPTPTGLRKSLRRLGLALSYCIAQLAGSSSIDATSVLRDLAASVTGAPGSPYSRWAHGPSASPNFFPIGVWLQGPGTIAEFRAIGINTFVGFYGDLDEASLASFADAGMPLIPTQNSIGLAAPHSVAITGWNQPDEPDNAQPNGWGGHGPCLSPAQIVSSYNAIRANDPTRPVELGFGRGVSNTTWPGRGSCTGETTSYYPLAVAGGDIISFDIYPIADYGGELERVPNGLDNLKTWIAMAGASKIIWNAVEAVPIFSGPVPTADQERAEVWMSIIHGSQGIIYFVHQFSADGNKLIRADGIFNFPNLAGSIAAINTRVTALAPVLNSPTLADAVSVSSPAAMPISAMVKQYGGATYIFAVAMLDHPGTATFTFASPSLRNGAVQVLDEDRGLTVSGGVFHDAFTGYGVHLYQISGN